MMVSNRNAQLLVLIWHWDKHAIFIDDTLSRVCPKEEKQEIFVDPKVKTG